MEENVSKDNEKKKKVLVITAIIVLAVVLAAGLFLAARALIRSKKKNAEGDESKSGYEQQINQSETGQTEATATKEKEKIKTSVSMQFKQSNSWESNGRYYAQYDLVIDNKESVKITDWTFKINTSNGTTLEQSWNCTADTSNSIWSVVPVEYNKIIESQAQMNNVGFIISFASKEELTNYTLNFKLDSGAEIVLDNKGNAYNEGTEVADATEAESTEAENSGAGDSENSGEDGQNSGSGSSSGSGIVTTIPTGALHVSGTKLVDASGNIVQLRGVSTHGISWFPDYVNYDAFSTLKNDWGANVVRLAMYPREYNGYLTGGNKDSLKQIIDNGVNYATQLGMYVIIDWHVLNYAPSELTQEACEFFAEMASKYSGHDNVIYEICNEPLGADWNSNIKPYAETVISTIRQYDDHAVILVGTNTWSQDVDAVIGNTLDDDNVMYVAHFYAATHKDNIRNKISAALNAGVPIFVSECSICDASGNGDIDEESAKVWLDFMNSNQISFIAWSLCNKAETSALISSGCTATSGWDDSDLTKTGIWFKKAISGQ